MTLQQKQLDELAEWMTNMEDQIQTQGPMGSDLPEIKQQIQKHKVSIWKTNRKERFTGDLPCFREIIL